MFSQSDRRQARFKEEIILSCGNFLNYNMRAFTDFIQYFTTFQ